MSLRVAMLGATTLLGREILSVLDERQFPADEVIALGSRKTLGAEVSYGDNVVRVRDMDAFDFAEAQLCIMAVSDAMARKWAQKAAAAGCIVIDTSAAFRGDAQVPLVMPEVNADAIDGHTRRNIIACPDASSAMLAAALRPLHEAAGVTRAVVTTLESVSGAGKGAMDELWNQTKGLFVNQAPEHKELPRQIAFNLIPQVDDFMDDGFTEAETRLSQELRRLIDVDLQVVATCVRTPVFAGHAATVSVELADALDVAQARQLLRESPGVMVMDRRDEEGGYATPLDVVGEWATYVSRIREDPTVANGLTFWTAADNLRAGGALIAVRIAELLVNRGALSPGS